MLNEDFLKGVKISNNISSFCFANPPYGESAEEKKRLEQLFLERIAGYMRNGGYLALVIPYGVFKEEKFFRAVLGRFSLEGFYRFDDKEYENIIRSVQFSRKSLRDTFGVTLRRNLLPSKDLRIINIFRRKQQKSMWSLTAGSGT